MLGLPNKFVLSTVVLLAAFLTLFFGANASSPENSAFYVLSNGADTCGDFVSGRSNRILDLEWILGYLSRVNSRSPLGNRFIGKSLSDSSTLNVWLEHYCQAHALDIMPSAAESLRFEIERRERQMP